tara:strand:- start:2104 stop:4968 length:2865 start_codon:yes stop_codon:yes gene_type:complete
MATISKTSKINFYKFVNVEKVSVDANDTKNEPKRRAKLVKSINNNTQAVNNLGATLNSIAGMVAGLKSAMIGRLELQEKQKKKFDAEYTEPKKDRKLVSFVGQLVTGTGSFFEAIMKMFGGLFKLFVVVPALKWLADPKNKQKVIGILEGIAKVVKFIFDWAKFGVVNTIEGLYKLLSDETSWWEKLKGFGQAFVGLGALFLGLRWLSNPLKIITDFGAVLKLFYNGLVRGKASLIKRALRFGLNPKTLLAAGVITAGVMTYLSNQDGSAQDEEAAAQGKSRQQEMSEEKTGGGFNVSEPFNVFSRGGQVPSLKGFSQGGWINGPQSGYPVSLDGGRSTSFIGHGSEYVARKSDGGAFVVPFNTPGTKTQPHLTDKRLGEAKSLGYKVPGFAQGGNLDKQIYLHWTATPYNWKKGPYHTTIQGDGSAYRYRGYDEHSNHTYYRNSNNVGISMAAMSGYNWDKFGPKNIQIENMAKEASNVALDWGWEPKHINIKRVMNHAEAASNKDGRAPHDNYGPTWWGGTGERSDLHKLSKNEADGSGGDKLRAMIKKYLARGEKYNIPSAGGPATDNTGTGSTRQGGDISSSKEYEYLQKLVLAEAGGEGMLGQALVARSVLNRAGLIQSSVVGPGMFNAKSGSVTDVINASGQYQPVPSSINGNGNGSINKPRSEAEMAAAAKAIKLAQNPAGLRGMLEAQGLGPDQINYLMAATGFRTGSAFNDPSQNVNVVKFKNHYFNTAGNKNLKTPVSEIGPDGGTSGHTGLDSPAGDAAQESSKPKFKINLGLGPGSDSRSGMVRRGASYSHSVDALIRQAQQADTNQRLAALRGAVPGGPTGNMSNVGPGQRPGASDVQRQRELAKLTEDRNAAKEGISQRTREMIQAVMDQVGRQNGMNRQQIGAAQQVITQLMSQASGQQEQHMMTSSMRGRGTSHVNGVQQTSAKALNSNLNPIKGLIK